MATKRIEYADKEALTPGTVRINQVWDEDMNEIKEAVNEHADVIDALELQKAPLASPVFTGVPAAPTPDIADDSSKLATTAFVKMVVAANPGPQGPSGLTGPAGPQGIQGEPGTGDTNRWEEYAAVIVDETDFSTTNSLNAGYFDVFLNGIRLNAAQFSFTINTLSLFVTTSTGDVVSIIGYETLSLTGGILVEKVFTVDLAMIGAADITDVDDVRTKLHEYTIAETLTKPANELHRWEVVESLIPTIPTLVLITDDLAAFAAEAGVTDVNDVAEWNALATANFTFENADFTDVLVDGDTLTLSGGTGALTLFTINDTANLIGFGMANLENLTIIALNNNSIDNILYFSNMPLVSFLTLSTNNLTVASLDLGMLDWATNEAVSSGFLDVTSNAEDLTTSDTYAMLVTTKSWTT